MASQFPPQGLEAFRIRMPSPPLPEEAAPDGNNSNIINNSRINNFQRILDRTPCFGGQCPVRSKRPLPSESSDAASKKRRLTKLPQGTDALEALRQRQCLIEQLYVQTGFRESVLEKSLFFHIICSPLIYCLVLK